MINKIIFTAVITAFSSMVLSCSNNQQPVDNNTKQIDPNTGTISNSRYFENEEESYNSEHVSSKPGPGNDPRFMDNPSAVNNAVRDEITPKNTVDSEPGYVDKPAVGDHIAGSDKQLLENEITQDNIHPRLTR